MIILAFAKEEHMARKAKGYRLRADDFVAAWDELTGRKKHPTGVYLRGKVYWVKYSVNGK